MSGGGNVEPRLSRYIHHKAAKLGYPCAGSFEITPRCNFDCKMCYVHLSKAEQERRGRELTAAEWIAIARQACEEGMVFLLLTGGEPTLRPDFPEIYTAVKKMGLMVSINSNGYLLRGEILRLLQNDPPYRINISLYGTSNKTYRDLCGIEAYDRVMENIRALRSSGIDVKVNMSLTDLNREDMQSVYEVAKELNIHTQAAAYMFPPVRVTGKFGGGCRMSAEDAARCDIAYKRMRMTDEGFSQYVDDLKNGIRRASEENCEGTPGAEMTCRAGRSSFWISWDGRLSPCGMLPHPSESVLELGVGEAWRRVRDAVDRVRMPEACNGCEYRHGCHVCAAICYCETGRFDGKPEYLCELTRLSFQKAIEEQKRIGGCHEDKA